MTDELFSENHENGILDECPRCGETWSIGTCEIVEGDALEIECKCLSCNFTAKQFILVQNVTWWGVREHQSGTEEGDNDEIC